MARPRLFLVLLLLVAAINHSRCSPVSDSNALVLKDLTLTTKSGVQIVDIGTHLINTKGLPTDCSSDGETCRKWADGTKVTIKELGIECTSVSIEYGSPTDEKVACIPLNGFHWFGGPEQKQQNWPLEKFVYNDLPMVTLEDKSQAIADPFWFNSNGTYILVDKGVPLFIDQKRRKEDHMCLVAKSQEPYRQRSETKLKFNVCQLGNAKNAFMHAVTHFLGIPKGIPDERMIRHPIWSTWARYKADVNESSVLQFAKEIIDYGFKNSQLELDDNWEECYGSATFNKTRFPDIKGLTNKLKDMGYRVTLWTHPFINMNCAAHAQAEKDGYLVKNATGSQSHWWNGFGSNIDFTKSDARKWYTNRLKIMMHESGIDGLKFDAGETSWMPKNPILNIPEEDFEEYPLKLTGDYVRTCAEFGPITEVRSAYRTQDLPVFLRMIDKDSKWGYNNGLRTLVTTLLQMNMVGYSFVLPDMIGGNQYPPDKCTEELFIRWLQANTFMPVLQFSIVPWDFPGEQVIKISKKFTDLHAEYADKIVELMKKNSRTGEPVNPPIWWVDPTDQTALAIDSEYMLGEDILVAPVMDDGALARDVYLPKGLWKDANTDLIHTGPKWIYGYDAPIDVLPYFLRQEGSASTEPPPTQQPSKKPNSAPLTIINVSLIALGFLLAVWHI